MSFVHLHRHSEYSRLDGIGTAKQYADRAAQLGQGALALTDHGTMSGALHHIKACRDVHILPIVGVEAYYRPNRKLAKRFKDRRAWHLCLYARNLKGWHSLLRLVSEAFAEVEDGGGFYQYPCVDDELLERHRDGLVASSACFSSWLAHLVKGGDSVAVKDYVSRMLNLFGDDFWVELMPHDFDDQRTLNVELVSIAQERSIPLLATNDAHFPIRELAETQRIAKIMGENSSLKQVAKDIECGKAGYLAELTPTLYLAHEEEMRLWFEKHHPRISLGVVDEAIANTTVFVQRTSPFLLDRSNKLPKVSESPQESATTLQTWISEGLKRLREEYPPEHWEKWSYDLYVERANSEWEMLLAKGVIDYFVMVGDVCRWAKSQGIRVGLGRGSAAGCLISYLIGITAIDPISYGLLFERFLNPTRKGLPDIDLDFDSERRAEVKAYLAKRYGQDHVADIITHSTFQPRKVIQDLCRVFDVPWMDAKEVTDTIDIRQDSEATKLEELIPINDTLTAFRDAYPELWKHALALEGLVANAGKHAAGIIITPGPVNEYMALERGKKGDLVTSWSDAADFPAVSDHGFVKLDCLGITGLSKHEYACQLILERTGEWIDLNKLDALRDPEAVEAVVMERFCDGYTTGIFQFGSRGITNLLREIHPSYALDLTAANALYRPGAMKGGVTWDYAKRKHGHQDFEYWHPLVEPVLSETHGLIAYQEQVMEVAKQLGGFSGGEADDMRKAMGKLYRIRGGTVAQDFMRRYEAKWFAGTDARDIPRPLAQEIWDKLLGFGQYGFNKSHSACYALQAYQDMYLKANYPAEFYAAFLTYEDDDEKCKSALREAKLLGIEIVMPDINASDAGYTVDDEGRLVLGLMAIKGVGGQAAEKILKLRPFHSIEEVMAVAIPHKPLIESGACDELAERAYMLSTVPKVGSKRAVSWTVWEHLKHNTKIKKQREIPEVTGEPAPLALMQGQAALLNLPVSTLSMTDEQQEFILHNSYSSEEIELAANGEEVTVGGEITKLVRKQTKRKTPFANVTIVFGTNSYNLKLWEHELLMFEDLIQVGKIISVAGKKDEWKGYVQIVVTDLIGIETLMEELAREEEALARAS
jgi:DNA polymerase-3 subunit alpha